MCWPTFSPPSGSGGVMQVEERRARYPGEPRNRRLRLVNERERSSDEWRLVGPSRGSRRSGIEAEHWQLQQPHVVLVAPQAVHYGPGGFGQLQEGWPQQHPHELAHHHQQGQIGYPHRAQIRSPPQYHQQHAGIQVINDHEEDGHHNQQPQVESRAPMPQNLEAHHHGGGRAHSQSHGHHDNHRYSYSSSEEESHRGGRRRSGRILSIVDDDSFDDLRQPVRQWKRRSNSHRSTSRRRR